MSGSAPASAPDKWALLIRREVLDHLMTERHLFDTRAEALEMYGRIETAVTYEDTLIIGGRAIDVRDVVRVDIRGPWEDQT